jgi:fatty acid/phospholipid biosynthesis enzyme
VSRLSITQVRDLVRSLNYVVSLHAAEELEDDNLTILDLENIILTGGILERQKHRETRETKIVIRGRTLDDRQAEAVIKVGPTGALYIITVYLV